MRHQRWLWIDKVLFLIAKCLATIKCGCIVYKYSLDSYKPLSVSQLSWPSYSSCILDTQQEVTFHRCPEQPWPFDLLAASTSTRQQSHDLSQPPSERVWTQSCSYNVQGEHIWLFYLTIGFGGRKLGVFIYSWIGCNDLMYLRAAGQITTSIKLIAS